MKYMGSKNRIANQILPIILKDRKENQYYVEPFVGGCNVIDKVDGKRIGNDSHLELISMWQKLQCGWIPPIYITEIEYHSAKVINDLALKGYIGFNSYGGKWFGGYRRDSIGKRNYWTEHYNNLMKQVPKIKDIVFTNLDYINLDVPDNSIIYCDPPYENTTSYDKRINHLDFWQWCRDKTSEGHTVYVSEYKAPDDFTCVWESPLVNNLKSAHSKPNTNEKLFILK